MQIHGAATAALPEPHFVCPTPYSGVPFVGVDEPQFSEENVIKLCICKLFVHIILHFS